MSYMVTDEKLPMIQNVMASSFSSESTAYFISPKSELNKADKTIPESTRLAGKAHQHDGIVGLTVDIEPAAKERIQESPHNIEIGH